MYLWKLLDLNCEITFFILSRIIQVQKQSSISALIKRCSEDVQQIYRRTPVPKCDFNICVNIRSTKLLGIAYVHMCIYLYAE